MTGNRLKFVATIIAGQSPASDDVTDFAGGHPFLQGKAEFGELHPSPRYQCAVAPKQAFPGDVLVSVRAPVGAVNVADQGYGIGRGLGAVRADSIEPRYLRWVLVNSERWLRTEANGSTFEAITAPTLGNVRFAHDDLPTQKCIADYLDRETGEIDAMLATMDELTQTLEARRRSVIDRELMPYVGVSTARLGLVAEAITGLTYAPADVADSGGTVVHRSGSIQNSRIDRSDLVRVTTSIPERLRLRNGDLLVCSRNGSAHLVGKNALVGAEEVDETWGAFMTVLRSPNNRYLRWYLQSTLFADERSQYSTSTINQLTIGMINRMEIPFPDPAEQKRIADHLDEVTGKIDQMLAKTAELKNLLIERRAALITDVVTGKKQVP